MKIIAVVGPTASGKSELAVWLAKKFGGEIISADSRQVYRGLDIGTGKITKREMQGVPHHLLDVASPRRAFSAARYKELAERAVRYIVQKGKIPIVAGGTGFYFDVLFGTVSLPDVPPDEKLRKKLEKETTPQLVSQLKRLDPHRAREIDTRNRRRLIRAIEIAEVLGKVPPPDCFDISKQYDVLWIGVSHPPKKLRERIRLRLHARMRRGMVAEAKRLHTPPAGGGLSYKRMRSLGLEYRHLADYLEGKLDRDTLLEVLEAKIWQYAKRQLTWFKRNKNIQWHLPTAKTTIERKVRTFLST